MKHIRGILSITLAIFLAAVAIGLFALLFVPAYLFTIIRSIKKEGVYEGVFNFFFLIGKGIDQTSNGSYKHMLNAILIKDIAGSKYHHFGNEDETLSSVLGRNQMKKSLSWVGWILVVFLYIVDIRHWGKGGHCIQSIGE
jgi:8-oxo-dGTP diphosphatase